MIQGSLPQKQQEQADRQRKKDLDGVAGVDGSILCKLKILNPSLFQAILHFLKEQMFARKWKKTGCCLANITRLCMVLPTCSLDELKEKSTSAPYKSAASAAVRLRSKTADEKPSSLWKTSVKCVEIAPLNVR